MRPIWADPNDTIKFTEGPQHGRQGVPRHDARWHRQVPRRAHHEGRRPDDDIVRILKETQTDVVVSYLPVGSEQATKWYVEQVLEAGCAFVNCIPVFIASTDYWNNRFVEKGLPIIGDDIKSQVGATIVHRTLARLFHERGVHLERTSQLNSSAATWTSSNMLERERLESKKISKTQARDVDHGPRAPGERRVHRPLGLRAVAD